MTAGATFRGQPLLLLAGVLAGWLGVRAAVWQSPPDRPASSRVAARMSASAWPAQPAASGSRPSTSRAMAAAPAVPSSGRVNPLRPAALIPAMSLRPIEESVAWSVAPPLLANVADAQAEAPFSPARVAIGHNLLLAAGLAQMEVPVALLAHLQARPGIPAAAPSLAAAQPEVRPPPSRVSRWSADGWLVLRRDTARPLVGTQPTYGRSQAGAVIRYSLAPSSPLRPRAHLRASASLAGARERELAAGLSLRPIAQLPVRMIAEARVSETERGTELRPAAYAVTEIPALKLPLGTEGEAYLQGGYVGGQFATPFIDGQARIERPLARTAKAEVSAGGGAWGGAQRGAVRLDIGPTAAVSFRLGGGRGRIAADYRFRVAGDAAPSSGPALTLSAGF